MTAPAVRRVALSFSGSVVVAIRADLEDSEAWCEAVANAWAAVSDNDIANAANVDYETILPSEPWYKGKGGVS